MTVRRIGTALTLLVVVVATLIGRAAGSAGQPAASVVGARTLAQQSTLTIAVDMMDIRYSVTEIRIPANTDVTITLVNTGATVHTFNIDALNVHSGAYASGETGRLTINAPAGDYQFYCSIPGHKEAGMVGVLHVVQDLASPTGGTPGTQRSGSPVATSRAASPSPSLAADIPSPFECQVDGVTWLDLVGLVDEVSEEADQGPDPSRLDRDNIRGGQQVSPEDFQGILATTREVVACVNAEEPFQVAGLLSDRFLARLALDLLNGEGGITELLNQLPALSQQIDPEQDLAMIPITAAWYPDLPDKTIFAILEPHVEGLDEQRRFLVVFTYEKHRWLIDAMVLVE